jgi:signal transduction histidine kinase
MAMGHVLVVDPSSTVRSQLSRQLTDCGLTVTAFATFQEALQQASSEAYALAIIDRDPQDATSQQLVQCLLKNQAAPAMSILLFDRAVGTGWSISHPRVSTITDLDHLSQHVRALHIGTAAHAPQPPQLLQGARILVVDDSQTFRAAMRLLLSPSWEIIDAEYASQAIPLLRQHAVDAVLLDNALPDGSGIDVCREIRAIGIYATLPIIMLTASNQERSVLAAFDAGADDYVVKGGSEVTLMARLGAHIRRFRAEATARRAIVSLRESEAVSAARNDLLTIVQRKTEELQRANEELDRFAALASHDLKAPLRLISNYLGLISHRATSLDERLRSFLDQAMKASGDASDLVERLLHYARSGWTDVANDAICDSREVAALAVSSFSQLYQEAGGSIEVLSLPLISCDALCLRQVFENLIGNALKYRSTAPPRVQVSWREERGFARFAVSDNGVGVPERHRKRIFGMFQRLHGADIPGVGIGLSLCSKIVVARGGEIGVESAPAGGSVFFFTLPMAPSGAQVAASPGPELQAATPPPG